MGIEKFKKYCKTNKVLAAAFILTLIVGLIQPAVALAATSPTLGAAASYSILGHTTVTNTGPTTMPGDLGISIGGAPVGFPPGTVGPPGTVRNAGDSLAAQNADTAAFGFIDQGCDTTYAGTKDLVASNLVAGVYCADAFQLSGTLTLNGTGVWIFKSASTLVTSGTANVVGGNPCNVWWRQVSSATLGTNTSLIGNVLSSTSNTLLNGASLNGRAFAQTGAITLNNNTITGGACIGAPVYQSSSSGTGAAAGNVGLPQTGSDQHDNPWLAVMATALLGGLLALYTVRRKRTLS